MNIAELKRKACDIRISALKMVHAAQQGHIGGAMSCADYLTALFYARMKHDPSDPKWEGRDRFLLSKGHTLESYYAILADCGYFAPEELMTFCQPGSRLGGHPTQDVPGVEMNTGSLGHGFAGACGMAMGAKLDRKENRIYVLMGDGEMAEGSNWEAMMFAGHYHLDNLYAAIDRNHLQISGATEDLMSLEPLEERVRAFGFAVETIDGNDMEAILAALERMDQITDKPKMLILDTIKGKGVSYMENQVSWHHGSLTSEQLEQATEELLRTKEAIR